MLSLSSEEGVFCIAWSEWLFMLASAKAMCEDEKPAVDGGVGNK